MIRLAEWLLDLNDVRFGQDAPVVLRWDSPLPAWALFCLALAAGAWVVLVYRREPTSVPRRIILGAIRCGVVALAVAILCGPFLVLERNRVEPSYVVVAMDTSQSMARAETYSDAALAQSVARGVGLEQPSELSEHSRLALARTALVQNDAAALGALLRRNSVQLCAFAEHLASAGFFAAPESSEALADALSTLEATGRATDVAGAIRGAIDSARGRRLAAIVLATDGQSTQPVSLKDALDLAHDRRIPVYPIRIGSTQRPRDIEVDPLRAQETVFVNDLLAVEAPISVRGLTETATLKVALIDERSGRSVASEQVTVEASQTSVVVELRTKPARSGLVRYRVEVSPLEGERTLENNNAQVDVTVLDNRLRLLYVDGYPRYEYRYLKNAALREQTVELSVLLIEADDAFVQEGSEPIRRFPETPEELNRYDVVLFGDVDPRGGWLSRAQMDMLLDFVGNRGGGFGLIAGERSVPHRFLATPLEKLIPVRIDPTFFGQYDTTLVSGFQPRLTREGQRSRVFRFAPDHTESERLFTDLPELYWLARTLGPKPGAAVLAEHPTIRSPAGPMPVVVTGRYGAGALFFQATDDTWRWRRHRGELLHDTYWVRVLRELMPGARLAQDRRFVLRTDRRVYPYGASVQTQIDVFDSQLLSDLRDVISIVVTATPAARTAGQPADSESAQEPSGPTDVDATTRAVTGSQTGAEVAVLGRFDLHRLGPESNRFEGAWVPPLPGRFTVEATELPAQAGQGGARTRIRVEPPDLEASRPEADHETLDRIARTTGGSVLELDALVAGFDAIPDRTVLIPDDVTEPLWDSRLALLLFVGLISVEWILRKAFGLL
jgi:hypothetical protein